MQTSTPKQWRLAAIVAPLGLALLTAVPAYAVTELSGCAAKREAIQQKLSQANESREIAGLEKAMDEVNAHCRDDRLTGRRNRDVLKAQNKVNEAEHNLRNAQEQGRKPEKIATLKSKRDRAQAELKAAEAALKR